MKNKEIYENPEILLVEFQTEDTITASSRDNNVKAPTDAWHWA